MTPILHRIIQSRDLPKFTGLKQTRLDELIAAGTFPKPVKLSSRRVDGSKAKSSLGSKPASPSATGSTTVPRQNAIIARRLQ